MKKNDILIITLILFLSSYVYAFDFSAGDSFDFPTNKLNDLDDVSITNPIISQVLLYNDSSNLWHNAYLNDSAHHVNASDYLITNIGAIGNFNAIQFLNALGTLAIDTSWLTSFVNQQNSVAWNRSGTNVFLANTGDSVGIGTTSPEGPLDVRGGTTTQNFFFRNTGTGSGADAFLRVESSGSAVTGVRFVTSDVVRSEIFGGAGVNTMNLRTGGTSALFIDSSQQVGIGTTTPNSLLDIEVGEGINKDNGLRVSRTNTNKDGMIYGLKSDGSSAYRGAISIVTTAGAETEVMSFDLAGGNLGNIGIGATNPQNKLDILGAQVIGSSYAGINTAPTDGLLVEGNVGIGTTSPSTELDIAGILSFSANKTRTAGRAEILRSSTFGTTIMGYSGGTSNDFSMFSADGTVLFANPAGTNWLEIPGGVRMGFNTRDPQQTLNVVGTLNITNETGTLGLFQGADGRVGIGTASPSGLFHTDKTGVTVDTEAETARFQATTSTGNSNTYLKISSGVSDSTLANRYVTMDAFDHNPNSRPLVLQSTGGNVGIGTTSPGVKLEVIGNSRISENLTIGDRLFVEGVTELDDRLFVGIDLNQTTGVLNPGDAVFAGNVLTANGTFIGFPAEFGNSMILFSFGDDEPGKVRFFFGANAEMNTTTGLFCDTTNNPFFANSTGRVLITISSAELSTTQISFDIISLINSSCVSLDLGSLGGEVVPDLTSVSYATRTGAVFEVYDKGKLLVNIGSGQDTQFKVNALNATGSGKFFLNTIAGSNNVLPMLLSSDANGFRNMGNIISSMRSSEAINGTVQINVEVSGDLNNYTNGEYAAISLEILGEGTNVSKTGLDISSQFDTIITIAQEETISRAYYDDTSTTTDITNQLNDSSTTTSLFESNGSIVYIGNLINFTSIIFSASEEASSSIAPLFFYCNSSNEYQSFSPADGTGGFIHSGSINFVNPDNRGTCNQEIDGTPLADTTNHTYIAIQRTEQVVAIAPTITTAVLFIESSKLIYGNPEGVVGAENTFVISNEVALKEGEPSFAVTSRDPSGQRRINFALVSVQNESGAINYNSLGLFPDNDLEGQDKLNFSKVTNLVERFANYGIQSPLDFDTVANRTSLAALFGVVAQQFHIVDDLGSGLLSVFGDANIILRNNEVSFDEEDLDVIGPIHIRQPKEETIGVDAGDPLTRLLATFEQGVLNPFFLITSGKGADDWLVMSDINCPSNGDFCTHAGATGGTIDTIMQSNFTTDVTDTMNLTFKLNTAGMTFGGNFTVTMDDNEGNSEVLYSLFETDVSDITVNVSVPATYENKTLVTSNFIFSSSHPNIGEVWVDTIDITGNASVSTLANVTRLNSLIKFGDGEINATTGLPDNGIYYNDTSEVTQVLGNFSTGDRIIMPNGGSMGDNSTCAFIFYDSSGNVISTLGCI